MPRGVYDRGESKLKRLSTENEKLTRELRDTKHALEKALIELKALSGKQIQKPPVPAVAAETYSFTEQFTVLRENLQGLAEARKTLVNSDQLTDTMLNTLDQEIAAHLSCLSQLRTTAYPSAATKPAAPLPPPVVGQVPFPPRMPSGFTSAVVR